MVTIKCKVDVVCRQRVGALKRPEPLQSGKHLQAGRRHSAQYHFVNNSYQNKLVTTIEKLLL